MNLYIPFAIISILLLFLFRHKKRGAESIFFSIMLLAFIGAAIRYEFGPDYFNYHRLYEDLRQFGVASHIFNEGHAEPVFAFYLSLFSKYTLFIALNSFLWFGLYYLFFRKYIDSRYLWFVILLLFFNIDCILNNLVAMRTAMCAFLFILAYYALKQEKKILYILILLLCSALHTTCFMLLPLVFLNKKNNDLFFTRKFFWVVVVLAFALVLLGRNVYLQTISTYLTDSIEDLQRYTTYLENINTGQMTATAIIKYVTLLIISIIPLAFIIQGGKSENEGDWILIYKFGIVISTIGILLGHSLASRYMMILNPFYIAAIVRTLSRKVNPKMNVPVILSVTFISIYSFYFYIQEDYCVSFLQYHSILTAPFIP